MKNALVTGGTKGIGLATAKMLLREGYHVTATYSHDVESALAAGKEFADISEHFEVLAADQSCREEMISLVKHLKSQGELHCIVNNAGTSLRKELREITDAEWENAMNLNVNSSLYLIRDLFDLIPNDSRIIFIGSMMGIHPHSTSITYGVTKSAVHALALNLVKCFEGTGTTVNAIAPGFVETEWHKEKSQQIRNNIYNKTALKRFAKPEEIADAVKFCINNPFVNGSIIEVNGGYSFK